MLCRIGGAKADPSISLGMTRGGGRVEESRFVGCRRWTASYCFIDGARLGSDVWGDGSLGYEVRPESVPQIYFETARGAKKLLAAVLRCGPCHPLLK